MKVFKNKKNIMLDPSFEYRNGDIVKKEDGEMFKILSGEYGYAYIIRELYFWEKLLFKLGVI